MLSYRSLFVQLVIFGVSGDQLETNSTEIYTASADEFITKCRKMLEGKLLSAQEKNHKFDTEAILR